MDFYIFKEGQQSGPHSEQEISSKIASKELLQDDLVWYAAMNDWEPLGTRFSIWFAKEEIRPAAPMHFPAQRNEQTEALAAATLTPDGALQLATDLKSQGQSPSDIVHQLIANGLKRNMATTISTQIFTEQHRPKGRRRRGAGRDMLHGGLWFGGGLILTILGHAVASEAGGGGYIVFTGAIIFGCLQFFRGLIHYFRQHSSPQA